ncbi:MAG: ATP-dependent Clp protease ATP-binding subunit [bacterium]|nr:ATP-dependent Clp protease ATP-binding subunit [bacterium]
MIIFKYFIWHYLKAPFDILKIWTNFLKFFFFYFIPVPQLLKTLFNPWKRDIAAYQKRGFDIKRFFDTLALNAISRSIGFFIRFLAIIFAITIEVAVFAAGPVFLAIWLAWPAILAFSFSYPDTPLPVISILVTILFLVFFKNASEKPADKMEIGEILKKRWSKNIWERLGIEKKAVPRRVRKNPEEDLAHFLKEKKIKREDFETALIWEISRQKEAYTKKRFWLEENLFAYGGLAGDLSYGYAPLLERYTEKINALSDYERLIGHREELAILERILSKDKQSNALVVGEPGVGKMSLIQKFARMSKYGQTLQNLSRKRVCLLDLNRAMAGIADSAQMEERLIKIFAQARAAGNIILAINDFHNFVDSGAEGGGLGKKDISQIITPFLEGEGLQFIAVTTYKGLHEHLEKRPELMGLFEKIEVKEPDKKTTERICQDSAREVESRIKTRITVQAIREIVEKADLYITDAPFPEKALDLLEETAIYTAVQTSDYFVRPEYVDAVISQKTEIPIGRLEEEEKEKLANLEDILHKRIINQNGAINDIASAMRRARLGIGEKKRPIGSFLFMGPTGVGKTETAKALAEIYFGSEKRMNRFDMSEFQGMGAIEKMIGSKEKGSGGLLTTAVKENPFALLLLDEIEKADYGVLNLFLQVLDEGWLTDAIGKKINFRNQIIIATSNAGAELIRTSIGEGGSVDDEELRKQLLDDILKRGVFRPEFLNRFDGTVIFKPLSRENLFKIAELMLNGLKKRLAKQDIIFNFDDSLCLKIAELGYDPANGARPMRRVIQKKVEDLIAKKMLTGEIKKRIPFAVRAEDIS